jgi:hypothetical protein
MNPKGLAQLRHLLNNHEIEVNPANIGGAASAAKTLQKSIQRIGSELSKTFPTATAGAKLRKAGNMLKSLPPTATKKAAPMSGDALLAAGEALLKSHRIDAGTAAELQTAVHLGRVSPDLLRRLSDACNE